MNIEELRKEIGNTVEIGHKKEHESSILRI